MGKQDDLKQIPGEKILEMRSLLDEVNAKGEPLLTQTEHDFLEKLAILTEEVFELTNQLYPDISKAQKEWIDDIYEKYYDYITE